MKPALMIGALLGWTAPVAMMIALFAALMPSLVLIARNGRGARKLAIPFALFLAFGAFAALFAGEFILNGYLHHFT